MKYFNEVSVAIVVHGIVASFQTVMGVANRPAAWQELPAAKQQEYIAVIIDCVKHDIEQSTVATFYGVHYEIFPFHSVRSNNILSCTPVERLCVIQAREAIRYLLVQIGTTIDSGH